MALPTNYSSAPLHDRSYAKCRLGKPAILLRHGVSSLSIVIAATGVATQAQSQTATRNLVSACSGVSLPRSAVTGIITPVVNGIVAPTENRINSILGLATGVVGVPPLTIDTAALLGDAAAGKPITLQVLNAKGVVVGPDDRCDLQADSFGLNTQGGVAIGGNRITGLGTNGQEAAAGEVNSIALGNAATTAATSANAMALGTNATVGANASGGIALGSGAQTTAGNSVALGTNSVAGRGALTNYTALGLGTPQSSVGEVSIGSVGAERQITNVAAGSAPTDAVNEAQLAGVAAQVGAVSDRAVLYDGPSKDRVTLAGAKGTTLTNLAPGAVGAASTDAVNGSQLFATNSNVTNNTNAITNLTTNIQNGSVGTVQYANPDAPTVPNGGTPTNDLTLVGATTNPVALHNVAAGTVAAGSTDAVNGGQLYALGAQVGTLSNLAVQYDDTTRTRVTLGGAGAPPVTIGNVAAGAVAAGSTEAVNGSQLNATNTIVANNTTAITNLTNGAAGPVQYSNAGSLTVPNGGTLTNEVTLVGGAAGAVGLHNVANGSIAAGSTDAVNGGQVYSLALTAVNAVSYTTDASGARTNTITLQGGNAAAPVTITNVANGAVGAESTDAVNGGQLYTTNQAVAAVQSTASSALALGQNSVQYDDATHSSVTLGSSAGHETPPAPVAVHNVAPGVAGTDAVNVAQLNSGLSNAVTRSSAYTDQRIAGLTYDLGKVRKGSYAGSAGALAAAGLPQAYEAGKGMIAMAAGTYQGQSAFALGLSKAFNDGHTVMKLSGTYDTQGRAGGAAGVGYQF